MSEVLSTPARACFRRAIARLRFARFDGRTRASTCMTIGCERAGSQPRRPQTSFLRCVWPACARKRRAQCESSTIEPVASAADDQWSARATAKLPRRATTAFIALIGNAGMAPPEVIGQMYLAAWPENRSEATEPLGRHAQRQANRGRYDPRHGKTLAGRT